MKKSMAIGNECYSNDDLDRRGKLRQFYKIEDYLKIGTWKIVTRSPVMADASTCLENITPHVGRHYVECC